MQPNQIFKLVSLSWIFIIALINNGHAQNWSQSGTTVQGGSALKVINGNLYTCGMDTGLAPNTNRKITLFNGIAWDTLLGKTYSGSAYAFEHYNGHLYVGGNFRHIGDSISSPLTNGIRNLARWDGIKFDSIGAFPVLLGSGDVHALKTYNNELYMGGDFYNAAGQNIACIAKYNGNSWSPLGTGLTGTFRTVYSMTEYNGDLIVAGTFSTAGGIPVANIVRWDGNQWFSMGDGLSPYVFCVLVDTISNILYASGNIGASGPTPISYIASWDGFAWQQVGNGLPVNCSSWGISMYKGILYAGTGGPVPNKVMRLIGQTWQPLSTYPTNNGVYDLCEFQGSLYAAGSFSEIDSVCCYYGLAKYTDTTVVGQNEIIQHQGDFNIYPNPSSDKINLVFNDSFKDKVEVTINNSKSIIVLHKSLNSVENIIELFLPEHLSSGIYICTVSYNGNNYSKRFYIE